MTCFIHTADLHIGRSFSRFPEALAARLRAARVGAIDRLAAAAVAAGARNVVVAGDFFDGVSVPAEDLRQAAAAMGELGHVEWWVLPGNHDPAAAPVWDAWRASAPPNAHLLDVPLPVEIEAGLWVLPAPISGAQQPGDPTQVWEGMTTPAGAVRIGLAHGSVLSFGSTSDPDMIDTRRAARMGLAYTALGDWHGQKEMSPGVVYAGTPEADSFGVQGRAMQVDIAGQKASYVSIDTGSFAWHATESRLPPSITRADAARLVQEAKPNGRARTSLWRWKPLGQVSTSTRAELNSAFAELAPDFFWAQADWSALLPVYDPRDAEVLAPEGALRGAVERLMVAAANGPDPVADRALSLLASALKDTH